MVDIGNRRIAKNEIESTIRSYWRYAKENNEEMEDFCFNKVMAIVDFARKLVLISGEEGKKYENMLIIEPKGEER